MLFANLPVHPFALSFAFISLVGGAAAACCVCLGVSRAGASLGCVLCRLSRCCSSLVCFCYVGRRWESREAALLLHGLLGRFLGAAGRGSGVLLAARLLLGGSGCRRCVAAAAVAAVEKKR